MCKISLQSFRFNCIQLLPTVLGVTSDHTRAFMGIYSCTKHTGIPFTSTCMTTDDAVDQTSSIFCTLTVISLAKWTENAHRHNTKAMWHGLTWSWILFWATTRIWSSIMVQVGQIWMLLWIRSQCPRSPKSTSLTSTCVLNALLAGKPSPASKDIWKGSTIKSEVCITPPEYHRFLS